MLCTIHNMYNISICKYFVGLKWLVGLVVFSQGLELRIGSNIFFVLLEGAREYKDTV